MHRFLLILLRSYLVDVVCETAPSNSPMGDSEISSVLRPKRAKLRHSFVALDVISMRASSEVFLGTRVEHSISRECQGAGGSSSRVVRSPSTLIIV